MKRSTLVFCVLISVGHALWKELGNLPNLVPDAINPLNLLYVNRCVEDLGCFYTGPPFFHAINRPLSLPPTSKPDVKFHLFTPNNPVEEYELWPNQESLRNSSFNATLGTKILIHGFMSDLDFNSTRFKIKNGLLKAGNYNVIVVDWTSNNGLPYAQAVANTRTTGAVTARLVQFLMNNTGITPQSIHIIGHSLGAHTAGYIGERIPHIGRITGLDPAGPYFQEAEAEVRLDVTDADYVDVIHTDGAEFVLTGLGISQPIGHVDFYPNGGRRQPGCSYTSEGDGALATAVNFTTQWLSNQCDHSRCMELFLDSILDSSCKFMAVQCNSYKDFEQGKCLPNNSRVVEMGFYNEHIRGLEPPAKFFLRTNSSSLFCVENSIYL